MNDYGYEKSDHHWVPLEIRHNGKIWDCGYTYKIQPTEQGSYFVYSKKKPDGIFQIMIRSSTEFPYYRGAIFSSIKEAKEYIAESKQQLYNTFKFHEDNPVIIID